jgi:glycyl-tRNA synthetase
VERPSLYLKALAERKVMVHIGEREASIREQLSEIETSLDAQALEKERVIPQVLHLVEWPMLTFATFDEAFLRAPKQVLISEMVEHQMYFPIGDAEGNLRNMFIITADNTPNDLIREGNQKVLSARLSDGTFLYEQDLETSFDVWNEKLKSVTFQKELGSVYDKVTRMGHHLSALHELLQTHNPDAETGDLTKAQRAVTLCKADLASQLVNEFPDLQGVIGAHYAQLRGEDGEVAQAIDEHWMPRGESAPLPKTMIGALASMSDKIDNLLGCFLAGLKPTSSSDPYALRRQVLGLIRILLHRKLYLPLPEVFKRGTEQFSQQENVWPDLSHFITNRIKTIFAEYGVKKDEIEASLSGGFSDIYDTFLRVQALHQFRKEDDRFGRLFEVFKRAKGQLDGQKPETFDASLLVEEAEKQLADAIESAENMVQEHISAHAYDEAYASLATLQPHLARMFDEVRVLAEDDKLKRNRIALLQRVFQLFERLLDFSKIQEGQRIKA